MKNTPGSELLKTPPPLAENPEKSSLPLREQYLREKDRIKNEIGDLEDIRLTLGLSQRRVCQLLLVDPSAWTRWLKIEAPPHIYQALKWLIELKKINPEAAAPTNVARRIDFVQASTQAKIKDLENQVAMLERMVAAASLQTNGPDAFAIEQRFSKNIAELEAKMALLLTQSRKMSATKSPRRKKRSLPKPTAKQAKSFRSKRNKYASTKKSKAKIAKTTGKKSTDKKTRRMKSRKR